MFVPLIPYVQTIVFIYLNKSYSFAKELDWCELFSMQKEKSMQKEHSTSCQNVFSSSEGFSTVKHNDLCNHK